MPDSLDAALVLLVQKYCVKISKIFLDGFTITNPHLESDHVVR